jgi:hypothetical protein
VRVEQIGRSVETLPRGAVNYITDVRERTT